MDKNVLKLIVDDMKKNLDSAKAVDQDKLDDYKKGVVSGRICELGIYYDKLNAFLQTSK